jgi:hypothetical protein
VLFYKEDRILPRLFLALLLTAPLCSCLEDRDPDAHGGREADSASIHDCSGVDPAAIDAELAEEFRRQLTFGTDVRLFAILDAHPELICARYPSPRFGRLGALGYAVVHRPNLATGFAGLIERGADPDAALDIAAETGKREAVDLLLAAGADPNAGNALIAAVSARHFAVVRSLLEAGADPSRAEIPDGRFGNTGQTALHYAASLGSVTTMQRLIDAGADIDKQTTLGEPPLAVAIESGRTGAIRLLLESGADPDRLDHPYKERLYDLAERTSMSHLLP